MSGHRPGTRDMMASPTGRTSNPIPPAQLFLSTVPQPPRVLVVRRSLWSLRCPAGHRAPGAPTSAPRLARLGRVI
ncbi:hypothetical protein VTN02DRAFT_2043 [Thermoascus thermophilus]